MFDERFKSRVTFKSPLLATWSHEIWESLTLHKEIAYCYKRSTLLYTKAISSRSKPRSSDKTFNKISFSKLENGTDVRENDELKLLSRLRYDF